MEHGFDFKGLKGSFSDTIQHFQWVKLTQQPKEAVIPVVWEFYANAFACQHLHVADKLEQYIDWVQGKKISYSITTTNEFFGLESLEVNTPRDMVLSRTERDRVV